MRLLQRLVQPVLMKQHSCCCYGGENGPTEASKHRVRHTLPVRDCTYLFRYLYVHECTGVNILS